MKLNSATTWPASETRPRGARPKYGFSLVPKFMRGSLSSLVVMASVAFIPSTSYGECSENVDQAWNAFNEYAGALFGWTEVEKVLIANLKIARYNTCGSEVEKMTRLIQKIAHKVVDEALISQVTASADALTKLYYADPKLDKTTLQALALDLSVLEANSSNLSFEVLPVVVRMSLLKLGIYKILVEQGLRELPTSTTTPTSEYYRQVALMGVAIDQTEALLEKLETSAEDFVSKINYTIEYYFDNGDIDTVSAIGIVRFPDGTRSPASSTGAEADKLWKDCFGTQFKCRDKVMKEATDDVIPRVEKAKQDVRNKIFTSNYDKLRASLVVIREDLFKDVNMRSLAYKKPASQSQTSETKFRAGMAVDGVRNFAQNAIAASQAGSHPWWKVDLGRVQGVETVAFKSNSSGTANFLVQLLDGNNTEVMRVKVNASGSTEHTAIFRPYPSSSTAVKKGRYVKITLVGTETLKLSEVYVFGANIARGMPAAQSSTLYNANAARAVDGNIEGNFDAGSVTHTGLMVKPWWTVNLGAMRQIGSVYIHNRTGSSSGRLSNFTVTVKDASDNVTSHINYPGTVGTVPLRMPFGNTVYGQSVTIRLNSPNANYLSLAEVEVCRPVDSK